jgi:tetratricopeptide (TPR) repeat protein
VIHPQFGEVFKLTDKAKQLARNALLTLAFLFASGCVLGPVGEDGDASSEADQSAAVEEASEPAEAAEPSSDLPEIELSGELLYKVLIGELAAKSGELEVSAGALMDAARMSRDHRLAQRATRIALDAERFDLAMESASLWVELQPDREHPVESLALIMVEQGRIDDAEALLLDLLRKKPDQAGSELQGFARLLGQLSNREHALAVMKRIVAKYEDNADAYFAQAYLADRLERNELVMDSLDRALSLRPGWQDAALAKLGHLIQQQYPKEQIEAFTAEFLNQTPDANRIRVSYARYLVEQEASKEALDQFRDVLKHEPDNSAALMAAGLLSVQEEEYKDARRYFMRHLKLTPDNDQIRLYLGQVAEERERHDEAEKWYREISDRDQLFDARLRLATVIFERDGLDPALQHLNSLAPGDEEEFVQLALTKEVLLRDADELPRAKSVLDDAVARYPANSDLLYARGLLAAQLNQLVEHERDMRTLLAENPNHAHALNALGYTLADATDRVQEAYDLISKALSMRPDDPFILDSMGWVQYRLGNNQDAVQYLERALSIREDAEIAAHLGEVLWVMGETDRARNVWTKARQEHPDNDVLNETIERLTQ